MNPKTPDDPTAAGAHAGIAPSRTRYFVVVFAVALAVIQYIDRVCISQAAPLITSEFHFSTVQMGYVFAAFTWAYALFEIPGGWLGDKLGPRKVLTRVVLWWSFFTAATGWTWNFVSLVVTRALFGAGEAGCFPNLTKAFASWLRPDELRLKPPYCDIKLLRSSSFLVVLMIARGRTMGVLTADNKISRKPIQPHTSELLRIFGALFFDAYLRANAGAKGLLQGDPVAIAPEAHVEFE